MKAVVQRVSRATVSVAGREVGRIAQGAVVLLGVMQGDTAEDVAELADKLVNLRMFADAAGKMNLSIVDDGVRGGILLISQFTLCADTSRGRRPSFTDAAAPQIAKELYEQMALSLRRSIDLVATGEFGADMQVELINDGPVTFILSSR